MALAWYVARTRPLAEYWARDHLEARGIECFLPAVCALSPRRGRKDAPLFPGYLFTRYDLEEQGELLLRQVPQVLGLVQFGGVVPPVPDEVMADLTIRVKEINMTGGLCTRFRAGERVWVIYGATETLADVVEKPKSAQARVRVLLEFMGRLVPAQVPRQSLRPASMDEATMNERRRAPRRTRGRGRWIQGFGPRTEFNNGHRSS